MNTSALKQASAAQGRAANSRNFICFSRFLSGSAALTRAAAFTLLNILALAGTAAACPMCKEALAEDPAKTQLLGGWARSIYLLMGTPYVVFAGVTFAIFRNARKNRRRS